MENGGIDAFPEDTEGMIAHVLSCTHALTSIGGLIFGGAFTARQQNLTTTLELESPAAPSW